MKDDHIYGASGINPVMVWFKSFGLKS